MGKQRQLLNDELQNLHFIIIYNYGDEIRKSAWEKLEMHSHVGLKCQGNAEFSNPENKGEDNTSILFEKQVPYKLTEVAHCK